MPHTFYRWNAFLNMLKINQEGASPPIFLNFLDLMFQNQRRICRAILPGFEAGWYEFDERSNDPLVCGLEMPQSNFFASFPSQYRYVVVSAKHFSPSLSLRRT